MKKEHGRVVFLM